MQSTTTTIAVDLAKSIFQIAVSQHPGKVSESHRLTRGQFLPFFAERQPALVVLEACGTAHFWAREIQALGHQVELLPPHAVRCYVQRNKTTGPTLRRFSKRIATPAFAVFRSSRWRNSRWLACIGCAPRG